MEEGKKKIIMIIVSVACLALAITVTLGTRQGGGGGRKGKMWIKCNNPDCNVEYQLTNKKYMETMANSRSMRLMGPMMMMTTMPVLVCQECEEESAYQAAKCSNEECGIVFIQNFNSQDYPDRCPECGISEMEESEE